MEGGEGGGVSTPPVTWCRGLCLWSFCGFLVDKVATVIRITKSEIGVEK